MSVLRPKAGFTALLERALEEMGAPGERVDTEAREALETYLEELVTWGRRMDLTAARSPEELVDLTLGDAVTLAATEPPDEAIRVVDVGTGAGAPGLVLAVLRRDFRVTLVEPRQKRVAFLRNVAGRIGLAVDVERAQSQALDEAGFDVAVSRATLPPPEWLREGARLATRAVWVLLARGEAPSEPGWRPSHELAYGWPLTGVRRSAVRYVPADRAVAPGAASAPRDRK